MEKWFYQKKREEEANRGSNLAHSQIQPTAHPGLFFISSPSPATQLGRPREQPSQPRRKAARIAPFFSFFRAVADRRAPPMPRRRLLPFPLFSFLPEHTISPPIRRRYS